MPKIGCKAETCGFNKGSYCNKRNVNIEGLFAKSKIGTFCESFQNPHNSSLLLNEMAKDMTDDMEGHPTINIACSANYCLYNEKNRCVAKEITIGNSSAKYRSETQCDSFKPR